VNRSTDLVVAAGRPRRTLPAGLVRALDWVEAHPDEPLDLAKLALVAATRPRTLEGQFRRYLDATPLGWVRQARLARTRADLLAARGEANVSAIALANGFRELGRFAGHYRREFGERPSATLARGRAARLGHLHDAGGPGGDADRLMWRAVGFAFTVGSAACTSAIELAEHARALAPLAALPVAISAWCHGQRAAHNFGASPANDRIEAVRSADEAVRRAPGDSFVLTLASGAQTLANRLVEAERLADRALAIDPWLPWAWVRRGWLSAYAGDHAAALRELRVTLELMPFEPLRHLAFIGIGCAHFGAGRFALAARWIDDALAMEPTSFWAERVLVAAAAHAGALGEAKRRARRLLRKDPRLTVELARSAWPFTGPFVERLGAGLTIARVPRG
jgi:AraC-like DNA-binding protein